MKGIIKSALGLGVIIGMVLLGIGFFRFLLGEPYRIAILAGTLLCAVGIGYAQLEGDEEDEVR